MRRKISVTIALVICLLVTLAALSACITDDSSDAVVSIAVNNFPESAATETWAWGVNDQWEPKRSSDTSKPYHYWWLKRGTEETLAYEFDQPYDVSAVEVYWLDFDHYDGNFRVPASWKLYYKKGTAWEEVEAATPYTVDKDRYNRVDFKPVRTTGLKIAARLQDGESGGILEWKVLPAR